MATNPTENKAIVHVGPVKRGRPSSYTDEIANEICERIANGEELQEICADETMPSKRTVNYWLLRRDDFNCAYARAREVQMHGEAEEIRAIADNLALEPEHKRIMVAARQWRAERLNRRVYGNSVQHKHEIELRPALEDKDVPPALAWLNGVCAEGENNSTEGLD